MSSEEHPHHRKKNSQVVVTTGGMACRPPPQMQNSATIVYCKEKENDRLMNKNYRMEEVQQDKGHKRQQSNAVSLHQQHQQAQVLQPQIQPMTVQANNSTINFKGLARYNGGVPMTSMGSTSTTPTNSTLPQSNSSNLTTVNKEVSRVREKRLTDEKPMTAVHQQQVNYTVNVSSTAVQSRKTELKIPDKTEFQPSNVVKDNTKEKPRPSITAGDKKKKKKVSEPDDFECNQELEQTHPTKSARQQAQPPNQVSAGQSQLQQPSANPSLRQPRFQLSAPVIGMFKNLKEPPSGRNYEAEIKEFEAQEALYNMEEQAQTLVYLSSRQGSECYKVDAYYIGKRQRHMKWDMRSVLLGWMMEIHQAFFLKREVSLGVNQTYHLSVMLTDLYFNRVLNIQKTDLQLVGTAAMYIAAKLQEQVAVEVNRFAASTEWKYPAPLILDMEGKITRVIQYFRQTLRWQLNPPTINMWANRIMQQWDSYIEQNDYARSHVLVHEHPGIFFKKPSEQSFRHYSQIMQLIDCSTLDVQTLVYQPKLLVLSFMYLVLGTCCVYSGKQFGVFQMKEIANEFPWSSQYMIKPECPFNDLYYSFMEFSFGLTSIEILPSVQYCATYFILPFDFKYPERVDQGEIVHNEHIQVNLEDLVSYQMYNANYLHTLKKRQRGV